LAEPRNGETEQVLALVGDAYDAALDPNLWPSVLEKLCVFARGTMANLFSQDVVNHHASRIFTWGGDPYYNALYLEKYARINPMFPKGLSFEPGEVMTLSDIMPYAEYRESRFYKEWAEPQGYTDFAGVTIEKAASSLAALAVVRSERDGLVDAEMLRRMRLVAPHLRRALLIGKVIDLNKAKTASFAETIDGLDSGVFLVDGQGRLAHANASGEALLEGGEPLKLVDGVLVAADEVVQDSLSKAFAAAIEGDSAMDAGGMALPLMTESGRRFIANVLPLTSGARLAAGSDYSAVAALFVREAKVDVPAAISAAAQLYGLTPAEEKVLRGIIEVGGIPAVAAMLGTSTSTVKTHLEHVFKKTGTRRQAELVKLIAGFDSPVRAGEGE
jgi:DNA-binding CsgD family transcriptional regulator/PAS domain-containing protein